MAASVSLHPQPRACCLHTESQPQSLLSRTLVSFCFSIHARATMATASIAVSLPFRLFLPPRLFRGRAVRRPRPIRASASSNASDVASGGRKLGALESRAGDLRALVASVPPAVASIQKRISPNFIAGFCVGIAFLAAAARQFIIRSREHDNRGSVADLVRRGQLKSGQRGTAKLRTYDDPFNNPLVKIDEGTSTAQMFGKEYRLAPVRLTKEQQEMHQKRRSRAYQWKRPTVFLREGDSLPPDVDPDTVRWIPANHPFAAASSEVDEETAKQNVYQKDGVPSRVKAEHEALQARLEASNAVTKLPSDPRSMQHNERPMRSSGKPSENLQSSKFDNQDRQVSIESGTHSSDGSLQSNGPEGQ